MAILVRNNNFDATVELAAVSGLVGCDREVWTVPFGLDPFLSNPFLDERGFHCKSSADRKSLIVFIASGTVGVSLYPDISRGMVLEIGG